MVGYIVGGVVHHAVCPLRCAASWSDCFIGVRLLGEWGWTGEGGGA